jgi:protein SCO1/2
LLVSGACSAPADTAGDDSGAQPAGGAPEVMIPAPDLSGVVLRTQDDEEILFTDLRGKPALLTFIYTRCPMPEMCPATTLRFQEVQKALSAEERAAVRLISVSFDPLDTPEVLAEYAALWEIDTSFWTLLTGDPDSVQRVAGAYGAWYEKGEGETYDHTMMTLLLLPDGSVHRIMTGSAWDSTEIADALRTLAAREASRP